MEISISQDNIFEVDVDGIVLAMYENNIPSGKTESIMESLQPILELGDFTGKHKQKLLLYQLTNVIAPRILIIGLGDRDQVDHEKIRSATAIAVKNLRDAGAKSICVDQIGQDSQSTAEGAILGLYEFTELKKDEQDIKSIDHLILSGEDSTHSEFGIEIANAQNQARRLAELPANIATPTFFVDTTYQLFDEIANIEIIDHNEEWARQEKMYSFLSVASGSDIPAKFMEIHYTGGKDNDPPLILAGKGITFDSGGISIKGSSGMGMMRGDCGGAAAVIGTLLAISKLKLPLNVIGLTPLTENMPSGRATKPADVVVASNGKSIEIDNTDAEGRLVLADALIYADRFNPHTVIDLATLTGSMMVALGEHYIGTFTRSEELWSELEQAGKQTFEKFWRMPLDDLYKDQLKSTLADIKNVGGRPAGAITAAMFLSEFTTASRWAHMDIAGTAWTSKVGDYKPNGMTGVPVRALVQFARNISA